MPQVKSNADIEDILAELEKPPTGDIQMHHHSLVPALYTKEWLHRLVPDGVALGIAAFIGHLQWLWPPARRRAIGRMSLMLARTPREAEVRKLARRQLVTHAVHTELKMRSWINRSAPVDGVEHVVRAVESGRPVIAMVAHLEGTSSAPLQMTDRLIYTVAHPYLSPQTKTMTRAGFGAYEARLGWRRARGSNMRLVFRGNAYRTLDALLARGEIVVIAVDVPGSSRTVLAGKTAYVGSGIPNLAFQREALIVPMMGRIEKRRPRMYVHEAIDPRDFTDSQELLDHLAALVGDEILRQPERVDPNILWRSVWREDSGAYPEEHWRRRRPVRAFRRRVRGKLAYMRAQLLASR